MLKGIENFLRSEMFGFVLGRSACLGSDLFFKHYNFFNRPLFKNQQKMRADLWLSQVSNSQTPPLDLTKFGSFFERSDIFQLVKCQLDSSWISDADQQRPLFFLIDSFSELTDQKFTHRKEGWSFCCHYSDLKHTPEFGSEFYCEGLLDLKDLDVIYLNFFSSISAYYPNIPILFFDFSTYLDERLLYRKRGLQLSECVESLGSCLNNFHHIRIPDSLIRPCENDFFPYHFSEETIGAYLFHMCEKIKEIDVGKGS